MFLDILNEIIGLSPKEHENYCTTELSNVKLRQEYSTTSIMVLAAFLSLRLGLNLALRSCDNHMICHMRLP